MGKRTHHLLLETGLKLILLIASTGAVLFVNTAPFLLILFVLSFVGLLLSGVSVKTLRALLKTCTVIILFVVLAHIIVCDGSGSMTLIGSVGISFPGMWSALKAVLRVLTLVCSLFCLTASLSSAQIVSLVQSAAHAFKGAGPRVEAFGRILALLVLFFPLCLSQLQSIHEAQELRGSLLLEKSVTARMRSFASTFVALLVLLFKKADIRALALRSRGF